MKRRYFIESILAASVPLVIPDIALNELLSSSSCSGRKLVLIHLSGGNDWYNTFIPFSNEEYYSKRPSLAIDATEIIRMNSQYGFNPAMSSLVNVYESGNMFVFNDFVCEHDDNSHYTAEQLWKTVSLHKDKSWLQRLQESYEIQVHSAKELRNSGKQHNFYSDLKSVSDCIIQSNENQVFTLKLDGFDTHQFQKHKHQYLLEEYSEAAALFIKELRKNGKFKDTLILTWSEFGRSINENIKKGTDHGHENSIMIMSGGFRKNGISISGDPETITITDIYASIIQNWFGMNPSKVLFDKNFVNI